MEKGLNLGLISNWIPPVWSPEGRALAKDIISGISEIYIESFEEKQIFSAIGNNIPLGYSPDGTKLMVDMAACCMQRFVYLVLVEVREKFLDESGFGIGWYRVPSKKPQPSGQEATWSPDGTVIAFSGLHDRRIP